MLRSTLYCNDDHSLVSLSHTHMHTHKHTHMHTHAHTAHTHTDTHTHKHTAHTQTAHTHMHTHAHTAHTHTHTAHMHTHTHTRTHSTHAHTHSTHAHTHIHTHTHTHCLMIIITMVPTTVPAPSTLVRLPLTLLDLIISVNLETLVYMNTECTLKTHCGMVMVQATAAVHRLGCRGSVRPSHRK